MYRSWIAGGKRTPIEEVAEMAVGLVCNGSNSLV